MSHSWSGFLDQRSGKTKHWAHEVKAGEVAALSSRKTGYLDPIRSPFEPCTARLGQERHLSGDDILDQSNNRKTSDGNMREQYRVNSTTLAELAHLRDSGGDSEERWDSVEAGCSRPLRGLARILVSSSIL